MSPSIIATRPPHWLSATARLTATVVFPTPPLPAPTAMMFFTPGTAALPASGASVDRTCAVISISTAGHAGNAADQVARLIAHLILHRARGCRQLDGERHPPALDPQILDELERHDVAVEIGIPNGRQGLENGCLGGLRGAHDEEFIVLAERRRRRGGSSQTEKRGQRRRRRVGRAIKLR